MDIVLTLGDSRVCCGLYILLELSDSIPSVANDFRALRLSSNVSKNVELKYTIAYMGHCSSFGRGTLSLPGRRANLTGRQLGGSLSFHICGSGSGPRRPVKHGLTLDSFCIK